MPRPQRIDEPELIYHVSNRGNGRMRLFHKDGDFVAFERVLAERPARWAERGKRKSSSDRSDPILIPYCIGFILLDFFCELTSHVQKFEHGWTGWTG